MSQPIAQLLILRHSRATAGALLVLGGCLTPKRPLSAQRPAAPAQAQTLPANLASITTDTGDFAPGRTAFERYRTPSSCLAATHNAAAILGRSIADQMAADSLQWEPLHDTLPAGVATVARDCSRRFSVATVPAAALPDLFDLALLSRDETQAQSVLERRMALAPNDSARFELQRQAIESYLTARPAWGAAAERLAAQLDAQGTKARSARMLVHAQLLAFGFKTLDEGRLRREAEQILALGRDVPSKALKAYEGPLVSAYQALLTVAFFTTPDSLPALARRAQQDLGRIPDAWQTPPWSQKSLQQVLEQLCPAAAWQRAGEKTTPLTADLWFPAAAKDTAQPVRGRVSLFVYVTDDCDGGYAQATPLDPISSGCSALYERLRRWHQQYGTAGLDMTLVASVAPGMRGSILGGPQSLEQGAQTLKWYFLEYLKLPVQRLAVQAIPVTTPLPAPDGRIGVSVASFSSTYLGHVAGRYAYGAYGVGSSGAVLTDRSGVEVFRTDLSTLLSSPMFEALLRRVVTGPTLATPPQADSTHAAPRT